MAEVHDTRVPAAGEATWRRTGVARGPRTQSRRLLSVDVMRGTVLAIMLLTPPIGTADSYPWLRHAAWLGWTLSDLVFPLFLFTSGASLWFLLRRGLTRERWRRLVKRLVALLVLGLLYNAIGEPLDLSSLRLTGVLQTIGISGFVATLAVALSRRAPAPRRVLASLLGAGAVVYTAAMAIADVWTRAPGTSPFHGLDVAVLGPSHVYTGGAVAHDPEGIVATVALSLVVLTGYLAADTLLGRREDAPDQQWRLAAIVAAVGGVAVVAALLLDPLLPIAKRPASPTWMLLAAGVGCVALAGFRAVFDLAPDRTERLRRVVAWPATTLGMNALIVFLTERVVLQAAAATTVDGQPLVQVVTERWYPVVGDRLYLLAGATVLAIALAVTATMRALRWRVVL